MCPCVPLAVDVSVHPSGLGTVPVSIRVHAPGWMGTCPCVHQLSTSAAVTARVSRGTDPVLVSLCPCGPVAGGGWEQGMGCAAAAWTDGLRDTGVDGCRDGWMCRWTQGLLLPPGITAPHTRSCPKGPTQTPSVSVPLCPSGPAAIPVSSCPCIQPSLHLHPWSPGRWLRGLRPDPSSRHTDMDTATVKGLTVPPAAMGVSVCPSRILGGTQA